jgi:hypothetical protein
MTIQRTIKLTGAAISAAVLLAVQAIAGEPQVLTSPQERRNYSAGVDIARGLKQQAGEVNLDILLKGLRDELAGEKLLMNEDELRTALAERNAEITRRQKGVAAGEDKKTDDDTGKLTDPAITEPGGTGSLGKEDQARQAGQLAAKRADESVAKRYEKRRETRMRAAEMRKKTIEQELQGSVPQRGGI